jgi:hypothetical protein
MNEMLKLCGRPSSDSYHFAVELFEQRRELFDGLLMNRAV